MYIRTSCYCRRCLNYALVLVLVLVLVLPIPYSCMMSLFLYVLIGFVAFVPTERRYEQLDRVIVIVFEDLVSIRQDLCKNY